MPPPGLVANKTFGFSTHTISQDFGNNPDQSFWRHSVCSFEKSNLHLKSICQKVPLNLWQLGLLDFGRTRKYFQQLSKPNREIQNTPLATSITTSSNKKKIKMLQIAKEKALTYLTLIPPSLLVLLDLLTIFFLRFGISCFSTTHLVFLWRPL